MGILNLDQESFYSPSISKDINSCLRQIEKMLLDGMDILDLGAFSSRPGSKIPPLESERKLLMPFIKSITNQFPDLILSIDTMRSSIAQEAIENGAAIINDISSGKFDPLLPEIVARQNKIYIAMHMRGLPDNMMNHSNTQYDDAIKDMLVFFKERLIEFKKIGLQKVIIDPGFGFSKNLETNYEVLKNLGILQILNKPVLVGISRKSMIWKTLNSSPDDALIGTLIAEFYAILQGCQILRVHDIKQTKEMLSIFYQLTKNNY